MLTIVVKEGTTCSTYGCCPLILIQVSIARLGGVRLSLR